MTRIFELETQRLRLRQWRDSDYPAFARLNADPKVMAFYPDVLSEAQSDALAAKAQNLIANKGWGFWALEEKATGDFIGFTGLHAPVYDLPVTPCVEIGWRLAYACWGKGYATEAALEALKFAFEALLLPEVYSFCSVQNQRSWAVMERLGMVNTGRNFEHPIIPAGNPLREHLLYEMTAAQWRANRAAST